MYLYSLTLQKPTGIVCAINGSFSGGKTQEIVVPRGKVLVLLRPDENGKLQTIHSVEVFGAIRSLAQFRLTGAQKDYIVVGSDSGRIVILEYNKEKNVLDKIYQETFGKSGCRRIVPGQYLAIDPKGRAVMIGACEKQKLVYVLNRDNAARLTISSPLEAHKSHTIVYSICGVDCGFDNPIFAAIFQPVKLSPLLVENHMIVLQFSKISSSDALLLNKSTIPRPQLRTHLGIEKNLSRVVNSFI